MRILVAGMMALGVTIAGIEPGISVAEGAPEGVESDGAAPPALSANPARAPHPAAESYTDVVRTYCVVCHNDVLLTGNTTLQGFEVERATDNPQVAERMIMKLRAGMMPPPGFPRPGGDSLVALVETLESTLDEEAARNPNPGSRTFQRTEPRGIRGLHRKPCWDSGSTPASTCRSTPRAPTSTTSPTPSCSPPRSWTPI